MITKGTKIKLVKRIGSFDKVGEICEVVKVNENAVITFKCSIGMGCMSYDELNKYFEVCEEDNVKIKKQWGKWEYNYYYYRDLNDNTLMVPVKYRNNGKTLDFRTNYSDGNNIKVKSSCNKMDKFNLDIGLDIADARMQIKLFEKELKKMIDKL